MTANFADLTPAQIETVSSMESTNGQLICWPAALTYEELLDLEKREIIYHVFYGGNTYGHTSYHLNPYRNPK